MKDRKPIKLSVFKGWGSSENIDAKINVYDVQHKVPDPLAKVELEDTLKAALRFAANRVRRTTCKESVGALTLSMCFMWVFLFAILWLMNDDSSTPAVLIVVGWLALYERFVILPRSKERYEQVARELEAGFRARGWQLEFEAQHFDSPMSAVAFFKLTPIAPSSSNGEAANSKTAGCPNVEEDEEAWVCTSNVDAGGLLSCLRPKVPTLLDGVPVSMKSSVDAFLWGPLTEACVNARMTYFQGQMCKRAGVGILSAIVLAAAMLTFIMYYSTLEHSTGALYFVGMLFVIFFGSIYFYYGMLSITEAMVAKHSYHPDMSAILKEFEPKFADAGFRMEYITEDQEIPSEYVRKGSCKSGQGFLRFVSVAKRDYVKISDTALDNGWLV
mmetsp:Transcript_40865/g.98552  ORF Transcript_40865/g.98552 Transcript_40865/m.98552 type:complete len:386 (+) Transcript_40865:1611-2768(+)